VASVARSLVGDRWILSADDTGHFRPAQAKIGGKLIC
jgi:hypothetical protein